MKKTKKFEEEVKKYMRKPYRIEIIPDPDGGFVAELPELPGCITQGETFKEVIKMIEDAKKAWIESALENKIPIPEPFELRKFSGRFLVRVPKSLHKKLVELAEKEGVSLNTLVVNLLSEGVGRKEGKRIEIREVIVYPTGEEFKGEWKVSEKKRKRTSYAIGFTSS